MKIDIGKINTSDSLTHFKFSDGRGVKRAKLVKTDGILPRLELEFDETELEEVRTSNLAKRID